MLFRVVNRVRSLACVAAFLPLVGACGSESVTTAVPSPSPTPRPQRSERVQTMLRQEPFAPPVATPTPRPVVKMPSPVPAGAPRPRLAPGWEVPPTRPKPAEEEEASPSPSPSPEEKGATPSGPVVRMEALEVVGERDPWIRDQITELEAQRSALEKSIEQIEDSKLDQVLNVIPLLGPFSARNRVAEAEARIAAINRKLYLLRALDGATTLQERTAVREMIEAETTGMRPKP